MRRLPQLGPLGSKLKMEDVRGLLKGGKHGPSLKPGQPRTADVRDGRHRVEPVMPPKDKKDAKPLTPENRLIKLWIDAGPRTIGRTPRADAADPRELPASVRPIVAVDLTQDGKLVAGGRGNRVFLYEVASARNSPRSAGQGHHPVDPVQPRRQEAGGGELRILTVWDPPAEPANPIGDTETFGPHVSAS